MQYHPSPVIDRSVYHDAPAKLEYLQAIDQLVVLQHSSQEYRLLSARHGQLSG